MRRPTSALLALALPLAALATELNSASRAEVESLPGVGPALAERILDERARGPFTGWSDFERRVKGVRAATARRLSQGGLTIDGAPVAPVAPAPPGSAASR